MRFSSHEFNFVKSTKVFFCPGVAVMRSRLAPQLVTKGMRPGLLMHLSELRGKGWVGMVKPPDEELEHRKKFMFLYFEGVRDG